MITQSINLNLITGQVLPRVNASQYDNNTRTLTMYLYDGELTFNIPNGVSGYIQGTKPDRTGFQYLATVTAGSNVVTFDITEQMTAVAGDVTCELVLVDGDDRIATVNFILHVEPAALSDDTVISETELPLIEEAAELAQQIGGFIEQMDADAAKSEAYGAGTVNGVPVTSDNPAYENNAKYYSAEAAASASGVAQLKEDSEAYILFSVVKEKEYYQMMNLIEEIDRCKGFLVAPVMNARAAAVEDMASYLRKSGKEVHCFNALGEAYDYGQKLIKEKDYLFCVGSLYMVGEIKAHLEVKYD